jgi:hypothetical protein
MLSERVGAGHKDPAVLINVVELADHPEWVEKGRFGLVRLRSPDLRLSRRAEESDWTWFELLGVSGNGEAGGCPLPRGVRQGLAASERS